MSGDAVNSIQCDQVIWTADQKVNKLIPCVTITIVGLNSEICEGHWLLASLHQKHNLGREC